MTRAEPGGNRPAALFHPSSASWLRCATVPASTTTLAGPAGPLVCYIQPAELLVQTTHPTSPSPRMLRGQGPSGGC